MNHRTTVPTQGLAQGPTRIPTRDDVRAAARRIAPYLRRTPVLRADVDGRPITFKLEHLQLTGAFKIRGALNAILSRPGLGEVVTASGGNHGLGVATAAALTGIPATVFVPETVPAAKERRIAAAGTKVIRHGRTYAEADAAARAEAVAQGAHYVPAYDDPDVVAGQGTLGLEIVADAPDCDTVAVAVGGGGLIAGVSLAVAPERRLVGVEPIGSQSLHAAVAAGRPVDVVIDSVTASALGASRIGDVPFGALRAPGRPAPKLALVTDAQALAARDRLWDEFRLAVEVASAVAFAAWLDGAVPGAHACVVLCGANADWTPA